MYGLNPDTVLKTSYDVYSDLSLDCCTAANILYYKLHDFNILESYGVSSVKELMGLIKKSGGLKQALESVLLSLDFFECKPNTGDVVFIRNAAGICVKPDLYVTRNLFGASLIVEQNVRGWSCHR